MTKQIPAIECKQCGSVVPRTGPGQLYCVTCSEERARARGRKWARNNPAKPSVRKRTLDNLAKAREKNAALVSDEKRQGLSWSPIDEVRLNWEVRVAVPFSYSFSKNAVYSIGKGGGHIFRRKKANKVREDLTVAIKSALKGIKPVQNKVWISIFVEKENHRGDAVNVVDTVCDSIKDAIPVDDRWFSIRKLDWHIIKNDPRLIVYVGQDADFDAQACSDCGQILPLENFNKNRTAKNGRGRHCRACSSVRRRAS